MEPKTIEMDGVSYFLTPANAISAWNALKKAGALLKGASIDTEDSSSAITALLSNLGDPALKDVEDLIYKNITVQADGNSFKLIDHLNEHFNKHRAHMVPLLVEGAAYQFTDFFIGGMNSLKRLMPQKAQKVAETETLTGSSTAQ